MKKKLSILKITRDNILNSIKDLSIEQLNKIPEGFNNNIIWNVAHVVVTQQVLVYKLSGVEPRISSGLIDKYKKGTFAIPNISQTEIDEIKYLLKEAVNWVEEDYEKGIFKNFSEYPTSYNFVLQCTEDAIFFNNIHEALHLGYIMAMKKLV